MSITCSPEDLEDLELLVEIERLDKQLEEFNSKSRDRDEHFEILRRKLSDVAQTKRSYPNVTLPTLEELKARLKPSPPAPLDRTKYHIVFDTTDLEEVKRLRVVDQRETSSRQLGSTTLDDDQKMDCENTDSVLQYNHCEDESYCPLVENGVELMDADVSPELTAKVGSPVTLNKKRRVLRSQQSTDRPRRSALF